MQHDAVIETIRAIGLSGTGLIASAASLSVHLNTPHIFLSLPFPYWFFLATTVFLTLLGAFLSLKNDYMRAQGTPVGNFFLALITGLVISFVILPVVVKEPSVGILQVAGLFSGMFGTIGLRIFIDLGGDAELRDEVKLTLKSLLIKRLKWIRKTLGGDE